VSIDLDDLAGLNRSQCHAAIGKIVGEQHGAALGLPPAKTTKRPDLYTRPELERAFREWAALNGGRAPTQRDWSSERDPGAGHRWPRAAWVAHVVPDIAKEMGIDLIDYSEGVARTVGWVGPWTFAVEVLGGLTVRTGGDHHAARSQAGQFGRNRQMVTAGVFAAPDVMHLDAALVGAIR
jgi:hypothetical protein